MNNKNYDYKKDPRFRGHFFITNLTLLNVVGVHMTHYI